MKGCRPAIQLCKAKEYVCQRVNLIFQIPGGFVALLRDGERLLFIISIINYLNKL